MLTPALLALVVIAIAASATAQGGPGDAALLLVSQPIVDKYDAKCLDGSGPALYVRRGAQADKWKFHIQGGGWCFSAEDCYKRSKSILGSTTGYAVPWLSQFWAPEHAGFYGLMDANSSNPFGDWSFAWFVYCDGSSFTGDLVKPISFNNSLLYFRGRANLDAILTQLDESFSFFSAATEVIVSGTSAGGLATNYHAAYIKSLMTGGARVVAAPDAGFFIDHATYKGEYFWRQNLIAGFQLWNGTLRGAGAACLAAHNASSQWECYFPENLYAYQSGLDGMWVLNSMYDTAQMGFIYQPDCTLGVNCDAAHTAGIAAYAQNLATTLINAQAAFGPRDGHFLTSCYQHEESCRPADWYGITINGYTPNTAFASWYNRGAGGRETDVAWPGDDSCAKNYDHGAC